MAITTLDGYIASTKQIIQYSKLVALTGVTNMYTSTVTRAGYPGTGVLAGTNTTSGVLVTSSTAGFPLINTTSGSYYLTRAQFNNTLACNIFIQDLIYKAGAYNFNANTTLSSQPSISSRVPGGTDYTNVSIWFETVTGFNGAPTITITYTNQSGVTGRSTGAFSLGVAPSAVASRFRLPLQSGDTGVQKIESVLCTGSIAGSFNILLVRDLFLGRIPTSNYSLSASFKDIGIAFITSSSALEVVVQSDTGNTGILNGYIEVSSG
jgi:hypothetical protein